MTKEDLEQYALENILEADSIEAFEKMQQWVNGALWMQQQLKNCNCANRVLSAVRLAETVINVMDKKGEAGCNNPTWIGFQNGNGTEIGVDIERLIKQAKRFLANCS